MKELEDCTEAEAIALDNLRTLDKSCHNRRHKRFEHGKHFFKKKENKWESDEKW